MKHLWLHELVGAIVIFALGYRAGFDRVGATGLLHFGGDAVLMVVWLVVGGIGVVALFAGAIRLVWAAQWATSKLRRIAH